MDIKQLFSNLSMTVSDLQVNFPNFKNQTTLKFSFQELRKIFSKIQFFQIYKLWASTWFMQLLMIKILEA